MIEAFPDKDPHSNLRHYWNWAPWVSVEAGGIIESFKVEVVSGDPALQVGDVAIGADAYASWVMAWISGGRVGETYTVRCRVTLTDGSKEDHSRTIRIVPK
jgi:hypothetical protein